MARHAKPRTAAHSKRSTKRCKIQSIKDPTLSDVKVYLRLPTIRGTQSRSRRLLLSAERANTVLEALHISTGSWCGSQVEGHNRLVEQRSRRHTTLSDVAPGRKHDNSHVPRDGEAGSPEKGSASVSRHLTNNSTRTSLVGPLDARPEFEQGRSDGPKSQVQSRLGARGDSQLACPYTKFDDATFGSCQRSKLRRIKDVRQHLKSVHLEQAHCPVCHLVFRDAGEEMVAHATTAVCTPRPMPPRTMTPELWDKVRERTRPPASSEEQRWYIIWETLFPTLPRPSSPYLEFESKPTKSTHEIDYLMRSIFTEYEQSVSKPPSPKASIPTEQATKIRGASVLHAAAERSPQSRLSSSAEHSLDNEPLPADLVSLDNTLEDIASDSSDTTSESSAASPRFFNDSRPAHQHPGTPITSESEAEAYTSEGSPASDLSHETVDEVVADSSIISSTRDHVVSLVIDRVMEQFWVIFDEDLESEPREGADSPEQRSTSGGHPSQHQGRDAPVQRGSKRGRGSGDEFGEEDDGSGEAAPPPSAKEPESQHTREFGCPFRKHSPLKYTLKSHRVCALNSWRNIPRLKEHLYRNHIMPHYCRRCWAIFDNEAQLDAHKLLPRAEMCEVRPGQPLDGITPAQVKELKSRKKRSRCQTEASRWRDIYRLLFPGSEVPSPYFEELEELGFVRREMPRLVRESLQQVAEQQTGPLEQALIQALPRLVQECLEKLERSMQGYYPGQLSLADLQDGTARPCPLPEDTDGLQPSTSDAPEQGWPETSSPDDQRDSQAQVEKSPGVSEIDSQSIQTPSEAEPMIGSHRSSSYAVSLHQDTAVDTFESTMSILDELGHGGELGCNKSIFCLGECAGNCVCWY